MAKSLSDEHRKMRLEMIDMVAQGIRTQGTNGYYSQEQIEYLTAQLGRVAKFLCLKD
jgi:hypothetical protein